MTGSRDTDLWRRVADTAPDAVWVLDHALRVVSLNASAERLATRSAADVVGRDVRELYPDIVGTDRETAMLRVLSSGQPETLRRRHERFALWVEIEITADPVGVVVRFRDVERLVELERRIVVESTILDSVGEGIYGIDANNRITFVNAAASRLLGYTEEALVGADAHDPLHHTRPDGSPYPREQCPLLRTLKDGVARDETDVLWRADGTPLPVEYHSAPIEENGAVVGAVVSFRDIRDKLAAEHAATAAAAAVGALHELQQVLQPAPPATDNPKLGVHYLPADLAGAGGDLYDWQSLPEDGMHLSVVDVVGKGLVAARDALAVTHALRLLVLANTPLEQVARQASWLLGDAYPDLAATAIVANFEPSTGRLRFVSAGHPPPLLIYPDGAHTFLEASGRPIGWPDAGTDDVVDITVPPGGRVVLYTDGLVEAARDIVHGMESLARLALDVRHLDAGDAARHLVTEVLATADRRDDCLALVLDRPAA